MRGLFRRTGVRPRRPGAAFVPAGGLPPANILCVQQREGEALSQLYGVVSDIFLRENRFTAQINRLAYISSASLGMQAVIDEAARILESPIVVMDSSYRVLSMAI